MDRQEFVSLTFVGVCPGCGAAIRSLQHDGYCFRCAGLEQGPSQHDVRRAHAIGHEASARLLRSLGPPFDSEAIWHEERARRLR